MHGKKIALLLALALVAFGAGTATAQKYGGVLKSVQRGNPPSLSIHEEATFNTNWPMSSQYNNLVYFHPLKPIESLDTVIPELAESWSWSSDNKSLTFKLHRGVKWHDGKPFTAKDVKHTFDVVRGTSKARLKLNPRRLWYGNVQDITTNGDYEVTFRLGRPQPSLVALLASGYSPVYPAHVKPQDLRTTELGTGPFVLTEYKRDQIIKVRKFKDYFVKGRPYLDGIDYIIIRKKGTRIAAMISGQVDLNQPTETDEQVYKQLKDIKEMDFNKTYLASNVNIIINNKQPPFNNPKLRRAVNMAINRYDYVKAVQPGYLVGGFLPPTPHGSWGIPADKLRSIPGYRDESVDKEAARKLMRELGYGPDNRFKVTVSSRSTANYVDAATWALGELKQIYIDAELEIVESGNWFGKVARRDFSIALNATGAGVDDPDVTFVENFTCGSQRNYSDYCNPEVQKRFEEQSMMTDQKARLAVVQEIEQQLVEDVARVSLGFRVNYNARRSFVKGIIGHNTNYSWARMQEVWLDK